MTRIGRLAIRLIGERVTRSQESVRSITAAENNRFSRAMEDLHRLSDDKKIPIALVGGMAAVHYGFRGSTEDIDIAIGKDNLERFLQYAPQYGFKVQWRSKSGWHTLEHGDVEINVVPEGGRAKHTAPTTIPGPTQMGIEKGLGVVCLPVLMELKLAAGRAKDFGHLVELLKRVPLEEISRCQGYIQGVHPDYAQELDRLVHQAEEEKQEERERGRD
jgi:hypothetical protein